MNDQNSKVCSGGPKVVFACSGAADVGAVADQAARRMGEEGIGSMFCLAGVGGNVAPIMEKAKSASKILAIDGCPLNCVSDTLKRAGITQFEHLLVTDTGLEKGNTPVNDASIERVATEGRRLLSRD
jgi:uncharacterized metal-binding protein